MESEFASILDYVLGFHALNARDNALIHWIFFELAKSDPQLFQRAMQKEAKQIRDLLTSRDIRYEQLKSSLVPTADGIQAVFLYDWREEPSWNYAVAFAEKYLPSLRSDLRTSMLHGDLHDMQGTMPIPAMEAVLVKPRRQVGELADAIRSLLQQPPPRRPCQHSRVAFERAPVYGIH